MKNHLNKKVCAYLIKTQIASDGGKNIWSPLTEICDRGEDLYNRGYKEKVRYMKKAIELIDKDKQSGFTYFVNHDGRMYVTYFSFKLNGKRYQISFHSLDWETDSFLNKRYMGGKSNIYIHWDRKHDGSRLSCMDLTKYLGW